MNIKGQQFRLDVKAYNAWYLSQPVNNGTGFPADEPCLVCVGVYEDFAQDGTPGVYVTTGSISGLVPLRFLTPIDSDTKEG